MNTLESIGKISIPRNVVNQDLNDPVDLIELHGFSDASLQNHGVSICIPSISKEGNVSLNLIAAKSTLAPMKQNTIPSLQLLGNILLSRLMNSVKNALSKCILISNYFWTDFQVTLSWIKAKGKMFKPFVENRVCETFQKGSFVIQKQPCWYFDTTQSS